MKVRAGSGWQTVLADLSLILFMLTASAVSQGKAGAPAPKPEPKRVSQPLEGEPVAVYRPGPGAPPLGEWVAAQRGDPRQRLTIVVPYAKGRESEAVALAGKLAAQAGAPSRVIVEPGDPADAYAALTFDMAQGLQQADGHP